MDLRLQDVHLSSQRDNIYEMQNPANAYVYGVSLCLRFYGTG